MSILQRIRAKGGQVVRDGYALRITRGRLTDANLAWLQQPDNRDRLWREVWPLYDEWQERAAIREYDGGLDRADAEREAYREVCARC